jgi:large repetitive protein
LKTLKDGGFKTPKLKLLSRSLIEETRDHYWIQYLRGGDWIDLDPSFSDGKLGDHYAQVKEVIQTLPKNLYHLVTIRLVLEEQKDHRIQRRILLTHQSTAADISGQSLFLMHQAGKWTQPTPLSALILPFESAANALETAFGALDGGAKPEPSYENMITPVLILNDQFKVGDVFPIRHPANEATGAGGAISSEPISEWVEFEFLGPDGSASTTQRTIFDRIGVANRQAGRREASQSPLGMEHPLNTIFSLSFYTGPLAARARLPQESMRVKAEVIPSNQDISVTELGGVLGAINDIVALLSDRLLLPVEINGYPMRYCMTSPRLIVSAFRSSPDAVSLSLDLRRVSYRPISLSSTLSEKTFQLQLLRGVVDSVVESTIMDFLFRKEGSIPEGLEPGSYSASQVFVESTKSGIKPKLLKGAPYELRPALPEASATRISEEMARGHLVVVPETLITLKGRNRTAWWSIDKDSGETMGVTEDGLHSAYGEYIVTQMKNGRYVVIAWRSSRIGMTAAAVAYTATTLRGFLDICNRLMEQGYRMGPIVPFYTE